MEEPKFQLHESVIEQIKDLTEIQQEYIISAVKLCALKYAFEYHFYLQSLLLKKV